MEYRYSAFRIRQTAASKALVFFAARATEIDEWVGVPQRRRLEGEETIGWQREENVDRLKELVSFFSDDRNVVQNPLLCAIQSEASVTFLPSVDNPDLGEISITVSSYDELTLLDLIRAVRDGLVNRVSTLTDLPIDQTRLSEAVQRARVAHNLDIEEPPTLGDYLEQDTNDSPPIDDESTDPSEAVSAIFSEETQLVDFYQELAIRIEILARLGNQGQPDSLLGFSRQAMMSYLQPVVLVDGQHRLRGAVLAAQSRLDSAEGRAEQIKAIDEGLDPQEVARSLIRTYSRQLPVSLLLDASPSEHVFQFVVVNQKATPMGRALLGTIVSTSLSRDELLPVAERLRSAGIALDDSQAVAYMTRASESPFSGLVQTGVSGDDSRHLQWTVLKGLTVIFRELRGARQYGEVNDFAQVWREKQLPKSAWVNEAEDASDQFRIWSAADGPWRVVFCRFFSLIRDHFGNCDDPEAPNSWGNTESNLYNKISLTILVADYFEYLSAQKRTLSSVNDVDSSVEDWLEETNPAYFNRDWGMKGLKKDQSAVKAQWAKTWRAYRSNPTRLPRIENYRP